MVLRIVFRSPMSKQWIRCSREIRSLANELSQMRGELQILQWSVAGVLILICLLCLWIIRMRRLQSSGRIASTIGTHVETINAQPSPTESLVVSPRGDAAATSVRVSNAVRYRSHVNVTPTVPQEALLSCLHTSHQLLPGSNTVSVYLTCLECRPPRKMDSTDRTHIPGMSRAPTNVASVVGKVAKTAKMMCVYVLMLGIVSFVDHAVHAFPVDDALSTNSPCVDMFQLDRLQSQNRVEQRVRKTCLMNRMDLVQLGGYVTNPEDPYTIAKKT